eukprot:Plantae.Rhodophyta-Palmaria_palmata.ctg29079.p1 GENE.Plantae.Rhodophyta-Palmaria_palmata.ctg29079~~Plantae.Rhodophyta-Palmaria_palmata.ctg29079.p1  ORF type:complete len:199 (-),score=13.39 Plantae.Rhodophyta-Palmaria_palmata.ctg29079:13-609(-)
MTEIAHSLPTADLAKEDVDSGPANYDGYLLAAAKRGNYSSMEEVLKDHKDEVNVDCVDGLGNCPLHYSANWGHYDTLELMLNYGADPNIKNFQDDTPLHRAFYKDNIPMIELLLKNGAKPTIPNKQGMKPGDYAQSVAARKLKESALGASSGLVKMAPPVPDRSSKRRSAAASSTAAPVDFTQMKNMKVDAKDLDEDI